MVSVLFFGSGVSYGTDHVLPDSPPLGRGLFDELRAHCPLTWGRLPESVNEAFEGDFEEGMERMWNQASDAVPRLMQDMAKFFARYRLDESGEDCYSQLVRGLRDAGVLETTAFSTLNYECLLEHALINERMRVWYGPEPAQDAGQATVWKLHGSCNFKPRNIDARGGVSYTQGVTFDGGIDPIDPGEVPKFCNQSDLYPCMSLYAPDKPNQMGRSTIEDMQEAWQNQISRADRLVIAGVRPYPPDEHIWGPLAKTDATIHYVGGPEPFRAWIEENDVEGASILGTRIQHCVEDIIDTISRGR